MVPRGFTPLLLSVCKYCIMLNNAKELIAQKLKNPRFRCYSSVLTVLKKVVNQDIVYISTECAASVHQTPFLRRVKPGCYVIEIQECFNNNTPIYEGSTITCREFIFAWVLGYYLYGFWESSSRIKQYEELLYQRDASLLFACVYLDLDFTKIPI